MFGQSLDPSGKFCLCELFRKANGLIGFDYVRLIAFREGEAPATP
jgi:hypothetical protein